MKVNFKNSLINNMSIEYYDKLKQNKAEINTEQNYIKERPAQAISFSGSAVSLGEKFVQNKAINKITDYVWNNEAAFTAIYSLGLAGIIKPLLIINQKKGSEEKDRQIIATKNFLQAFIGSFMSLTIGGGIIKKAVDIVKNDLKLLEINNKNGRTKLQAVSANSEHAKEVALHLLQQEKQSLSNKLKEAKVANQDKQGLQKAGAILGSLFKKVEYDPPEGLIDKKASEIVSEFSKGRLKLFRKNVPFVKKIISGAIPNFRREGSTTTFYEAFESFWKNSTGWITAIMKAKISSMLLPGVMAFLFTKTALAKKSDSKDDEAKFASNSPLLSNNNFKEENEKFKIALSKKTTPINFTGKGIDLITKGLANIVERTSMTKAGQGAVSILAATKKPSARMADLESILLTTYWLQNTARSKKIDPDQKLGLNIQTALVTVVSSISAALIDKLFDIPMKKTEESFKNVLTRDIGKLKTEIQEGKEIANLEDAIKECCSNLAGSNEIAKKLAKIGLNDESAIKSAIFELTQNYGKKISKMKSLTIFTLVVRLLVPVLMVPVGGKLKNKFKEFKVRFEKNNKDSNTDKA